MKIRIVQAGYENFTGEMGHIDFVDGVSIHDVNADFARSLGGIVRIEEVASDVPLTQPPAQEPAAPNEPVAPPVDLQQDLDPADLEDKELQP